MAVTVCQSHLAINGLKLLRKAELRFRMKSVAVDQWIFKLLKPLETLSNSS